MLITLLSWQGATAAVLQIASWYTTYIFVAFLLPGATPLRILVISVLVEVVFVFGKRAGFRRGFTFYILDTLTNSGGVYALTNGRLEQTDAFAFLSRYAQVVVVDDWRRAALIILAGIGLAVLPHVLWKDASVI